MQEKKISVLLIEDHAIVSQGIKFILEQIPEIDEITVATTGEMARKWMVKQKFDFYILDIELPDVSGFDLIGDIREANRNARILIHTMHEEVWTVKRLLQNEVDAIVFKSGEVEEIKEAVASLLAGEPCYYSPRFKCIHRQLKEHSLSRDVLSVRELEVLNLIAKGKNTDRIAEELDLSPNTIETYRKRLMSKLNASNMVDLIMKAINLGIIPVKGMRD